MDTSPRNTKQIDVTDPAVNARMLKALFQAPQDDGELSDRNAALNNLRAEVFQLRTQLESAREARDEWASDYVKVSARLQTANAEVARLRDALTEANQENEILREQLATARRMSMTVLP